MRAVIHDHGLQFRSDYPDPIPGEGECLIRVHYAGICSTDLQLLSGYLNFRGILGHEMVGTVISGSSAWRGKRVVSEINCVCRRCDLCQSGLAAHCRHRTVMGIVGRDGCFADTLCVPERNLHLVPDAVTDEEAVFVEPLAAAHQVLVQCPIEPRMNVSVVGSGRLGLLVAQVLRNTGCKLTVIGRNRQKLLFCEKQGIQGIHLDDLVAKRDRDVVVECSGSPDGLRTAMDLVRPRGTIVLKSTSADAGNVNLWPIVVHEVRVIGSRCGPFPEAIHALARKAVDVRPLISRILPLEKAEEAFAASTRPDMLKTLFKINARP
ncbi:MAG: alcohol dehydrogenase catalytic domain-containing protein [Planctomycetota bacterium]